MLGLELTPKLTLNLIYFFEVVQHSLSSVAVRLHLRTLLSRSKLTTARPDSSAYLCLRSSLIY